MAGTERELSTPLERAATITDVAREAGVSRQTVSNVVNAPHRVRPKTKERVEQAISQLRYQPNRMARSLAVNSTGMIGCRIEPMVAELLASVHDRLLHALAEAGRPDDHHLLLFTAVDADDETAVCTRLWATGTVDGVVLYNVDPEDPRPERLLEAGVPFVCFGRTKKGAQRYSWVDVDNAAGTEAAVDHLVAAGYRRIGFVGWAEGNRIGDDRAAGWVSAMDRHGLLAACHRLDVRGDDTLTSGAALASRLLDRAQPPLAIVATTDTLASGAMHAIRERGLRVGADVAVTGFDDTPSAAALGLTSVRQPIAAVGTAVMGLLFSDRPAARGDHPSTDRSGILLTPELVVRASSDPRS